MSALVNSWRRSTNKTYSVCASCTQNGLSVSNIVWETTLDRCGKRCRKIVYISSLENFWKCIGWVWQGEWRTFNIYEPHICTCLDVINSVHIFRHYAPCTCQEIHTPPASCSQQTVCGVLQEWFGHVGKLCLSWLASMLWCPHKTAPQQEPVTNDC